MAAVQELIGSTVALFIEIGGIIFIPLVVAFFSASFIVSRQLSTTPSVALLILSGLIYFAWSSVFVFRFELSPGEFDYLISGWRLTPPAQALLDQDAALSLMSREQISVELTKSLKAPEYVWIGADLTASRIGGSAGMSFLLFSIGLVAGRIAKPS
jgi:hypothetical protein